MLARIASAAIAASILTAGPSLAMNFPLSDTSIRSAYFLGQRYKASCGLFLGPYTKYLPAPKTGAHIELIQFLTPYAQLVREYSERVGEYSAQQAERDHRNREDHVIITVKILLTSTYSRLLSPDEVSAAGLSDDQNLRPSTFWKDFDFRAFDGQVERAPLTVSGKGDFICGKYGNCVLTGATVNLEFLASDFSSQEAAVEVSGPDGQTVEVEFYLPALM